MSPETITIIIPVYNVQDYIKECLDSVAKQTYDGALECIIVDDCGSDNSIAITETFIQEYCGNIHFRIVTHQQNKGLSAARNTGIREAKGEYLLFIDSDDKISPDCLERLYRAAFYKGKPVDMVVGNYVIDGPEIGCPHIQIEDSFLSQKQYIRAYCKGQIFPMAWNRLMRRDFLVKNNLYFENGLIHEDTLWNFQILDYVSRVSVIKANTYIYLVRENSLQSNTDYSVHFKANVYILGRLAEIMFKSTTLKYNKYVYDFIEQEKQRHLHDSLHSGNRQLVRELYTVCRSCPHYNPLMAIILFGYHSGIFMRILKRDLHYLMPFEMGLKNFVSKQKLQR